MDIGEFSHNQYPNKIDLNLFIQSNTKARICENIDRTERNFYTLSTDKQSHGCMRIHISFSHIYFSTALSVLWQTKQQAARDLQNKDKVMPILCMLHIRQTKENCRQIYKQHRHNEIHLYQFQQNIKRNSRPFFIKLKSPEIFDGGGVDYSIR